MSELRTKLLRLRQRLKGEWREDDHPRDDAGRFGEGRGGSREQQNDSDSDISLEEEEQAERVAAITNARDELHIAFDGYVFANSLDERIEVGGPLWEDFLQAHEEYDGIAQVDQTAITEQLDRDTAAVDALDKEVREHVTLTFDDLGRSELFTGEEQQKIESAANTLFSRVGSRKKKIATAATDLQTAIAKWERAGDPGAYEENNPSSVSRHERWTDASARLQGAADSYECALIDFQEACSLGRLHTVIDRILAAHEREEKARYRQLLGKGFRHAIQLKQSLAELRQQLASGKPNRVE